MSLATTSHDLKSLIRSWHPIVVIETVEEERVRNLLTLVAADLRIPFYEWSITGGLRRHRSAAVFEGTESVTGLLRELRAIPNEGIFLLKDFS
ncbi:MAG: AAA family ATPase, partial [Acidobacteria bacterium]|nr:AAA family ATPase [Acidobacteriota bacterium]